MFVRATADVVVVAVRDSVAAVAPRPAVESGACSTLHLWANPGEVGADFIGIPGAAGTLSAEKKPQVAGVFTDLKVAAQTGLSGQIDIDTRFITSPTALKLAVMVLGVACVIASMVAHGRAGPAIGEARRPCVAAIVAGGVGHLACRHRRRRDTAALAHHRRAVVGRRLQPDHRPGLRRRRLHRELLPLLRRHRGALRLVSVRARASRGDQHRQCVDAHSGDPGRHRRLADLEPLGAASAGRAAGGQPCHGLDGGSGVPGGLAAVQQRAATRAADRVRRDRRVGARRVRDRHPAPAARTRSPSWWPHSR